MKCFKMFVCLLFTVTLTCITKSEAQEPTSHFLNVRVGETQWSFCTIKEMGNYLRSNNMFQEDRKSYVKFVMVIGYITNLGNDGKTFIDDMMIADSKGRKYKIIDDNGFYIPDNVKNLFLETLNPEVPLKFGAIFEVAKDADDYSFKIFDISENLFTNNPGKWINFDNYFEESYEKDFDSKDFRSAITVMNNILNRFPSKSELYVKRGKAYQANGQYTEAIEDFTKAIELNKNDRDAILQRANCYTATGQYENAIKDFTMYTNFNSTNSEIYRNKAFCYFKLTQYDLGVKELNNAIRISPEDDRNYHARAGLYYKMGQFDLALKDFATAIGINPSSTDSYGVRAKIFQEQKDFQGAIREYTNAINTCEDSLKSDYYLNRGLTYLDVGDFEHAKIDAENAVTLNNHNISGYLVLAGAYGCLDKIDEAINSCFKAYELDKSLKGTKDLLTTLYMQKGTKLFNNKEYENAADTYINALQYGDNDEILKNLHTSLNRLGDFYLENLDYSKASKYYIATIDPSFYNSSYSSGIGLIQQLRNSKEYSDHKIILAKCLFGRGKSLYAAQKYQDAIRDFDAVLAIDSTIAEGYYLRGQAKMDYRKMIEEDKSQKRTSADKEQLSRLKDESKNDLKMAKSCGYKAPK